MKTTGWFYIRWFVVFKNAVLLALSLLICTACASGGKEQEIESLLTLDEAMEIATSQFTANIQSGTDLVIHKIDSTFEEISEFLLKTLSNQLENSNTFNLLTERSTLELSDEEQRLLMMGIVSDEMLSRIGHYRGAQVVITGSYKQFAGFSQFRLRAIGVREADLITEYSARIRADDQTLAGVIKPLGQLNLPKISGTALEHLDRAENCLALGRYDEAILELNRALVLNKDLDTGYFYRAVAYEYTGDLDKAIADYSSAINLRPNNTNALVLRGGLYSKKNDFDKAIADYNAALNIKPNNYDILVLRSSAYYQKGDLDRAIADYSAVLKIMPDDYETLFFRGSFYFRKGDYDNAIADFNAGLAVKPDYNLNVILTLRGSAYYQKKEYTKAIEDFEYVLRHYPNDTGPIQSLADSYFQRGLAVYQNMEYEKAIADFNAAIKLMPNSIRNFVLRASAYFDIGDSAKAIADLETALKIRPNNNQDREWLDMGRQFLEEIKKLQSR